MNESLIQNEKKFLCMASEQELVDFAKQKGIEGYRAKQVERWISKRWVVDPENMTDLSKKAQQAFRRSLSVFPALDRDHSFSAGGGRHDLSFHTE